jgi:hypothetical protein
MSHQAGEELFDHQVRAWTAGELRKALDGVPDHFPVTVVTADDEPGSSLAGPEQVVVSAGPWNGQGEKSAPPDRFEISLEWPPGEYYRRQR